MPKPAPQPFWKQVFGTLGGWPAMAGLAATACVGLWIGGVYSDNLSVALGLSTGVALEFGETLGTYDLLLLDG